MFESYSDHLVSEYDQMMIWKDHNYEGLGPSEIHEVWKLVIE
jgi:hypothetical protein